MIPILRIVLVIFLFFSLLLVYGFWHAKTHGAFLISIYDASADSNSVPLKDTEVVLRDKQDKILATGKSDSHFGTVYLSHPETGSCYDAEKNATQSRDGMNAWQRCFRKQSTWLMEWVRSVQLVDVHMKNCRLERIPVSVKEYTEDWWMWWVPLPHIGGKPYTYFRLMIRIDPTTCRVLT